MAVLDWARFSVGRFESWGLVRGSAPRLRATLDTEADGSGVRLSLQPDTLIVIPRWPWHSYDFDFASLGLAIPHLVRPEAPFSFEGADITYAQNGPPFADIGAVYVRFLQREQRRGRFARLYELEGPGHQGHRGKLWTAIDGAYLVCSRYNRSCPPIGRPTSGSEWRVGADTRGLNGE